MCEEKTKACSKCGIEKPLTEYSKEKTGKDGLRADCKECKNARTKKYKEENKEKLKAYKKKYREANKERIKAYSKKWREENTEYNKKYKQENAEELKAYSKKYRQENSEKLKAQQKKYYQENLEKVKVRKKKYYQENKDKARLYCQKRRALLAEATVEDFTEQELLDFWNKNEINYNECFYCEKEMPEGPEHIDHYYPLSKGGPHERANLRPSCTQCNLSKHAKQPETFMEELNNGL